MRSPSFILLFFLLLSSALCAQSWRLRKNENGIAVYTKRIDGSNFEAFRAVMTLNTTAKAVVVLLKDVEHYDRIFPDMTESRLLKHVGDSIQYQYTRTAAPWPVSDRDGIYKMTYRTDPETGAVTAHVHAVPDYLPEKEDVVRVRRATSYWRIVPQGNGRVRIEYEVHADPGGQIPGWLANSASVDVPFETFEMLRKALREF